MKPFNDIYPILCNSLQSLEDARLVAQDDVKKGKGKTLTVFGASMAAGIPTLLLATTAGIVVLIIGIIATIVAYMYWINKPRSTFEKRFKDEGVGAIVNYMDDSFGYTATNYISEGLYNEGEIFTNSPDRFTGSDHITGRLELTDFELSFLHSEYKTKDKDGKTHWHTIFKGVMLVADFHKNFAGKTFVLQDMSERYFGSIGKWFQSKNISRDELIYMEDPEFEKRFVVYGSDQIEARYILSPGILRRIIELDDRYGKGSVNMSFVNSKIFVAISNSKEFLPVQFDKPVTDKENLQFFYDQIEFYLALINELNLNTRIWSKQ